MRKNYNLSAPKNASTFVKSLCVVALSVFLTHWVLADENGWVPSRTRVFPLRYVPAQKVKEYLATLKIGNVVSQLPVNNALIVTDTPLPLAKAGSLVKLVDVDSEDEFVIHVLAKGSDANERPSNEQITKLLGDISIGTFLEPPTSGTPAAIIDIHNDALILLAPQKQINRITQAIEQLRAEAGTVETKESRQAKEVPTAEPAKQPETQLVPEAEENQAETDLNELFDKLLTSLDEAEKIAEEEASKMLTLPDESRQARTSPAPKESIQPDRDKTEISQRPPQIETSEYITSEPEHKSEELKEMIPLIIEEIEIPNGDEELELDLPEKVDVIALLDLVGKYLNIDYLYDPIKIRGEVTLKVQGPLKVKDLYALLESVLKFKGFAMSRKGDLVTIVPVSEALNTDPALHVNGGAVKPGDVIMTRIFDLDYVNTSTAKTLLTGMKLGTDITELSETNQLIITEFAYRMGRIEQLLELVDQPGEARKFTYRQLKYTLANTLTPKILTLVEQLGTISISVSTEEAASNRSRRSRRGRSRRSRTPATTTTTQKPSVFLAPDERTNRILMVGNDEEIKLVEELIDAFDIPQKDLRTIREYEIQYVDAEEVLDTLKTLGIITQTMTRPVTRPGGKAPEVPAEILTEEAQYDVLELTNSLLVKATDEQHSAIAMIIAYVDREPIKATIPYEIYPLENQDPKAMAEVLNELVEKTTKDKEGKVQSKTKTEDITIVADENTFSIIVYASKKNQEWIGNLISNLDKRRPQVLIDVTLVEVDKTDAFEYDLNIITNAEHAVLDNATSGLTALTAGVIDSVELGFNRSATGSTKGFYSSRHVQALLTAIQEKSYGRVLARPKVLVNDNEEGKIITTSTTNIAIVGTSTTEAGVTNTTQTYQPYSADIELVITPHISEGDLLRLEVSMTREDFDPETLGESSPPDETRSEINTTVTVPDGKTIILGGLIKLTQAKGGEKVPLLGDIPLVGALFRNVNNTNEASKLYVFVKANILRPGPSLKDLAQLEAISERNRNAFEKSEREFQDYQNLPGFPADRVDPLHVLEEE
jgi:general secretion pathway protein D